MKFGHINIIIDISLGEWIQHCDYLYSCESKPLWLCIPDHFMRFGYKSNFTTIKDGTKSSYAVGS